MIANILSGFFTICLLLLTVYYLLIYVDPSKKGFLSTIKKFLYSTIPHLLKSLIKTIFGEKAILKLNQGVNYLCYRKNPVIQIYYIAIILTSNTVYLVKGFKYVPGPSVG
jgi:hypothetical protein